MSEDMKMKGVLEEGEGSNFLNLSLSNDHILNSSKVELNLLGSNEGEKGGNKEKHFACKYCSKKFSNSQALGGHQNGHKKERAMLKRAKEHQRLGFGLPLGLMNAPNPDFYPFGLGFNRGLGINVHSMNIHKPLNYHNFNGGGYGIYGYDHHYWPIGNMGMMNPRHGILGRSAAAAASSALFNPNMNVGINNVLASGTSSALFNPNMDVGINNGLASGTSSSSALFNPNKNVGINNVLASGSSSAQCDLASHDLSLSL